MAGVPGRVVSVYVATTVMPIVAVSTGSSRM